MLDNEIKLYYVIYKDWVIQVATQKGCWKLNIELAFKSNYSLIIFWTCDPKMMNAFFQFRYDVLMSNELLQAN